MKTRVRFNEKFTLTDLLINTDRLYRNNGNGTFTNVSKEAGITIEGWGHAACITDINLDGNTGINHLKGTVTLLR